MKNKIIWFIYLLFFLPSISIAAPVILFSDIESGPKSGWSNSMPSRGAAVTVWGYGFGQSRGQSYITVNGVNLQADTDYAIWGESWPTPFYQRITFWLNDQMSDGLGDIKITVNGETSNALPFTIRTGGIYFIAANNPGGDGSEQNPFHYADTSSGASWLSNIQTGDIFYLTDTESYSEIVNAGNASLWMRETDTSGTAERPLAFLAYPGHKPYFDLPFPYSDSTARKSVDFSNDYVVFSGMRATSPAMAADFHGNFHRVIGNDFSSGDGSYTRGTGIVNFFGDGHVALGNNVHGMRSGSRFDHAMYISGCSPNVGVKLGWNYTHDNSFGRGPEIVVNHQDDRCPSDVYVKSHYIFSNVIHCDRQRGRAIGVFNLSYSVEETQEPEPTYVYNNLVISCGTYDGSNSHVEYAQAMTHTNGHARFYNNTLYDTGYIGFSSRTGNSSNAVLSSHFKNNIIHMNPNFPGPGGNSYFTTGNNNSENHFVNNLYYGLNQDATCSDCVVDSGHIVDQDPLFMDPDNPVLAIANFGLQTNSPAINHGVNALYDPIPPSYATANRDMSFSYRFDQFDLGAMEFNGGTLTYTISGTLSGLEPGKQLVLSSQNGEQLPLTANGSFGFATPVTDGSAYHISILSQPDDQVCEISNGSGTISAANVDNVTIHCQETQTPIVLFSDLESGPKSGWSSSLPNQGAAVTIWGYGFGSARGQSYVTVNGVNLTNDTDYANWGEFWPTPFHQRITFWLNQQMSDGPGEITVTVNGKTSESIPFTIRSGRIFFVDADNPNGDGQLDNPFHFNDADGGSQWLVTSQPGDIFYFKDSSHYTTSANGGGSNLWFRSSYPAGTATQPIALIAYPGQKPTLQVPSPYSVNFKKGADLESSYTVFSGFSIDSPGWAVDVEGSYQRVVGNDFNGRSEGNTQGAAIINVSGDGHVVLGNNLYGMTSGSYANHAVRFIGCSAQEGAKFGWNYLHDNNFGRGPEVYVYHSNQSCSSDQYMKSHYIFSNIIHCNVQRSTAIGVNDLNFDLGETEPQPTYVYNNLIVGCGTYDNSNFYVKSAPTLDHRNGHAKFFNNTLYDVGYIGLNTSASDLLLSTEFKNNVVYMNPNFADIKTTKYTQIANQTDLSHNLYYGNGDYTPCGNCLGDHDNVSNQDPLFIDPVNFSFELQPNSPAVDKGTNNVIFETQPPAYASINQGLNHILRTGIFDMGAMELNGGLDAYSIGGQVTGLVDNSVLVLQINQGETLVIRANGSYSFASPLVDGSLYEVAIIAQPYQPLQHCSITQHQGVVSGANVTDMAISCVRTNLDTDNDGIPDAWDNSPNTPNTNICAVDNVVLAHTFASGTQTSCRAKESITVTGGVILETDAFLGLIAPQVIIQPGISNSGQINILSQEPLD